MSPPATVCTVAYDEGDPIDVMFMECAANTPGASGCLVTPTGPQGVFLTIMDETGIRALCEDCVPFLFGESEDLNGNGFPDDCCPEDINQDGTIDTQDLLALLAAWGTDGAGAEIAAPFDVVDTQDLLALLAAWGAGCPEAGVSGNGEPFPQAYWECVTEFWGDEQAIEACFEAHDKLNGG